MILIIQIFIYFQDDSFKTVDDDYKVIVKPGYGTLTETTSAATGTTTYVAPFLTSDDVAREFALMPWMFGQQPILPIKGGTYTKYIIRMFDSAYGLDGANHTEGYFRDVELYVLTTAGTTELTLADIECSSAGNSDLRKATRTIIADAAKSTAFGSNNTLTKLLDNLFCHATPMDVLGA